MAAAKIKKGDKVVVLSGKDKGKTGEVTKALKVSAHRFTKSAKEKIEKAGGAVTVLGQPA